MNKEFTFHLLNETGKKRNGEISLAFDGLLEELKTKVPESREFSLARTHLEIACFFAKKSSSNLSDNTISPAEAAK